MKDAAFKISGMIVDSTSKRGIPDLKIEAWDKDLVFNDLVGSAVTTKKGTFTIKFNASYFREIFMDRRPDLFFKVFKKGILIKSTEDSVLWNSAAGETKVAIEVDILHPPGPPAYIMSVSGRITHPDDTPIPDLTIKAFDKNPGKETGLGTCITDKQGRYRISYTDKQLGAKGKKRADLLVKVFKTGETKEPIAASALILNALPEETVDLRVIDDSIVKPPVFRLPAEKLLPELKNIRLTDLTENDTAVLANKTGLDRREVNDLVAAEHHRKTTGIATEVFYGLFRREMPTSLPALLGKGKQALKNALTASADAGIIDPGLKDRADEVVDNLMDKLADESFKEDNNAFLRGMLDMAGLPENNQKVFFRAYVKNEKPTDQFWEELRERDEFGETGVAKMQFAIQLGAVTGSNLSLVRALGEREDINEIRDLARLDRDQWQELVDNADIPGTITDKAAYARGIADMVEDAYPTAVLAHQMEKHNRQPEAAAFLLENPGFDLNRDNTAAYIRENGIEAGPALREELESLQRVYRFAPRYEKHKTAAVLRENGLRSAHAVKKMGGSAFVNRFGKALGGAESARQVYNGAANTASMSILMWSKYVKSINSAGTYAVNSPNLYLGGLTEGNPDLETLFGSIDFCDCRHCRSVLSPAAYLADLLVFLESTENKKGFVELEKRRPDIAHILLSCINTNTVMPYIDLVNEVLENVTAPPPPGNVPQTSWTAAELKAHPEHINRDAYNLLKEKIYPWNFNLWREEARLYLELVGVPRYLLMEIFSKGATPGKIDIACEQLNITLKDYDVLAAGNNNEVYKYYGLQGISQMTTLQEVRTLFKFALLTYEELLELLESTYINPAGKEIDYGVTPCSLENAVIGLDNDEFAKLRRFRLLLKKTGWTKIGLDRALTAFNVTVIDDNLIIALSYIQRLREQVKASADTMLSWWSPLDTADYEEESSLYARLFLNETIVNLIEKTKEEYPAMEADIFRLNNSKDELAHIGETMVQPGYKPLILKALDIDEDDLELLIDEEMGGDDALNLAALSFVYRVVSFCEALRITVPQYLSLRALTGQTPLKSLTVDAVPEDTFNFFAVFDRIKVSGFDIETLDYLLRHIYEENSSIVPPEEDITDLLETMQTGLQEQLDAEAAEADIKNYLVQTTAGQFEIESEAMASLLETHLPHPGDTTKPAIEFFLETDFLDAAAASSTKTYFNDLFVRLFKIAVIIRTQAIRAEELEFLFDKAPAIGWLNFMDLPLSTGSPLQVEPLLRLAETYRLQDTFAGDTFSIFQVLEEAETLDSAGFDAFITSLSKNTGWKKEDIQFLAGAGGYNFTFPQYTDEKWLVQLAGAFKQLHKIKTSAQQVWSWNTADITFTRAAAIKNTVKGNFYIKKWQELAPPLRNLLREQQRDILQAYLLTADHNDQFENADDLYSHYLMDSEMAPCFMTSRIKLAISSIQLFVQRIMLGLEPALSFDRDNTDQWKWRKNYRVWEANRKIFIYPENWIEPELRDDKSPFFKELEEELLQDDIDAHSAERVYLNYLNKLNEVANLEIAGMYNDEELDILHVFARTKGDPHIYFYRRWEDECWSAWEKVDLEIEGDHLLPVVYNRRLFLFWPKFIEKAIENASDLVVDSTKTTFAGQKPDKYLEIQMCWSTYRDGRWAAKKISRDHVKDKNLRTKIGSFGKNMLTFRTHITPGTNILLIGILYSLYGFDPGAGNPTPTGWESYLMTGHVIPGFQLNACSGELEIWMPQWESSNPAVHFTRPKGNAVHFMKFINSISEPGDHLLEVIAKREKPHFQFHLDTILGGSTGSGMEPKAQVITPKVLDYKITPLHQVPFFLAEYPFFYEDLKRAFFIVPEDVYRRRYRLQAIDTSRLTAAHLDKPSDAASRFSIIPAAGGITTGVLNRKTARAGSAGSAGSAKPVLSDTGLTVVPGVIKPSPVISAEAAVFAPTAETWTGKKYTFWTFYHPYVCLFIKQLNRYGIDGLLDPGCADPGDPDAEGLKIQKISDEHFESTYWPTDRVDDAYPADDIDFDPRGAYSLYNWELFFHTPLFIAAQLSRNQKFEDAQKWFHFIFDPTRSEGVVPQRFWKTKPFYNYQKENYLEELQKCLNGEYGDLEYLVKQWQQNPFQPHLIARFRVVAYMKNVVMKYLDNLIAWGDMLFRRDSIESINEATQLYVLAAQILGKRPVCIESKDREPKTFAQLKSGENILEKVEVMFPAVSEKNKYSPPSKSIDILHSLLYFCLPENENLLGYWDTVADRLYKIRNCMNIEGVVRQLALFEPPIDPALLVKAAAAGVDIGSVLSDMKAPLPHYRFQHLLSKAVELCADVKTLGNSLLSALEKKDAEEMALLRSGHEIKIHEAMRAIKEKNIEEAETAIESLNKTKELAQIRHQYYTGREYMNSNEKLHLDKLESALVFQGIGQGLELLAGVLALIPQFKVGVAGAFGSPQVGVEIGGVQMSTAIQVASRVMSFISNIKNFEATKASIKGGYDRRQDDWGLQESLAAKEIEQIDIQIASAEIRKAIAEKDLQNQELQIENSKEVLDTMKNKYTNKQLYSWMTGQISGIYFQAYKMAYDMAKRAEKVFRFELGLTDSDYIQFGYWDSLKKGLLAGEKLHNDLKSLDIAFIEQNKREYEIGKHISMAMLNPLALVQLKEQGSCEVDIPEILFDLDYPGQYMRRIKSVSLTIPCVSGPYASVSCKLTLLQNRIRASVDTSSGYAYEGISDTRFIHNIIGIQSIAASSAQNDDGLFELNFRDERYLPFEGGGAVSTWRLELPSDFRAFDYNSISDVIIHMNYTAREGGDLLKTAVSGEMTDAVNNMLKDFEGNGTELLRVFSLKHEFSNDWHQLFSGPEQVATLKIETRHFPYIFHDWDLDLSGVTVFLQPKEGSVIDTGGLTFSIKGKAAGAWTDSVHGNLKEAEVALTGDPLGDWAVQAGGSGLDSGVLDNIYLLLRYTIKAS